MGFERFELVNFAEKMFNYYTARQGFFKNETGEDITVGGFKKFLQAKVNRSFDVEEVGSEEPQTSWGLRLEKAEGTISGKERLVAYQNYIDSFVKCSDHCKSKPSLYWKVFGEYARREATERMFSHKPRYYEERPPVPYKTIEVWDGDTITIQSRACINGDSCVTRDSDSDSFESNETFFYDARFTEAGLEKHIADKKGLVMKTEKRGCGDGTCVYTITEKNAKVESQAQHLVRGYFFERLPYLSEAEVEKIVENELVTAFFSEVTLYFGKLASIYREEVESAQADRKIERYVTFVYSCYANGCTEGFYKRTYPLQIDKYGREVFDFHMVYKNGDVKGDPFIADFIRGELPKIMSSDDVKKLYEKKIAAMSEKWPKVKNEMEKMGVKDMEIETIHSLAFGFMFKPWENFSEKRCAAMADRWHELGFGRFEANVNLVKKFLGIDLPHPMYPTTNYQFVVELLKEGRRMGNGIWDRSGEKFEDTQKCIIDSIDGKQFYMSERDDKKIWHEKPLKYFNR